MVDSPTTRKRLRKQELGTNTNTWGDDKLNEVLDAIDQSVDGWLVFAAVDGTNTLTTTNYTIADQSLNRGFCLTGGTVTADFTVVVPSVEGWSFWKNDETFTATVKTAAGTGVAIPAGLIAAVFSDGANVLNVSPSFFATNLNLGGNLAKNAGQAVDNTDLTTLAQVNALIAAGGGSGAADGTVKMDAAANELFLNFAILVAGALSKADNGDTMTLSVESMALADGGDQTSSFTAVENTRYTLSGTITQTMPAAPSNGDIVMFTKRGTDTLTVDLNSLRFNGSTTDPTTTKAGVNIWVYTDATTGWVQA